MAYGIIYKAINIINNKVYVGQTIENLSKRRYRHENVNVNYYFSKAIKKYGKKNFEWKILEKCNSKEEMDEMEFHYIKQYNSFGKEGYNLTYGGEGSQGRKLSEETKRKIAKKALGRPVSIETRKKISNANAGKTLSAKAKEKRFRNLLRGKEHPFFGLFGADNINSIKYVITDMFGQEFIIIGIQDFCKKYKINNLYATHLIKCAKGKRNHHKGYKCRYYDENADANLPLWELTNAQ